ncbi:MAG: DUF1127 domain-containing protein [Rhodobacteraceae bacterium]|uniref:Putative DUF1127 protein n=1 Tax=Salipiger profundus TaxID=1229727 RepID=A0A1U7CZT0_9RHOB|nr:MULTISPECIES: DUF1127 domain-containing protein [Salipiger]APX21368.1 putative DUF1127 protein [Salipiger profundus]MAB08778.1 DUF1127 domain-containing protein [Paracoccaceae bacterium]GGA02903.1 hypothetical protein GCM10011326_12830 [Salipiger profundus]SFC23769.1 protein of unknown function [Salipiger profundus]
MSRDFSLPRAAARSCRPARRRSLLARLLDLQALMRQRRRLAELDDAALRDIGISRADALREAARKPWDAPSHWRD